jgi:protein-S-isoprenylcysteine O-methyltransferase Ste14
MKMPVEMVWQGVVQRMRQCEMRNAKCRPRIAGGGKQMTTDEQQGGLQWRARLQRLRVPLGFVTAVLFVFMSQPSWRSLAWGAPLILLGVLIRAWASGHLRKNAELAVSGPYAHTRNPLYFGSFVLAFGCAVAGGTWWLGVWLVVFFLIVYWPVMQAEAAHMQQLFGDTYAQWATAVPFFGRA